MQFVQGIEGSEKDQAIIKMMIHLAKGLGLEVLAEGVEAAPQLEFLNEKTWDEVQGFSYDKPMTAQEIEKTVSLAIKILDCGKVKTDGMERKTNI